MAATSVRRDTCLQREPLDGRDKPAAIREFCWTSIVMYSTFVLMPEQARVSFVHTQPRHSIRISIGRCRAMHRRRGLQYAASCPNHPLPMNRTQRIRDPIHDLIVFESDAPLDEAAWELLKTPEFQRFRLIKQLGLSDFVYPGATHSRFAHSIGVFCNARRLVKLIQREIAARHVEGPFDPPRADVAVLAALLHDIGHGPFSHAFEAARKSLAAARGIPGSIKKHEKWTADIIENKDGRVFEILERVPGRAKEIADLLRAETPTDMYHAIVSSSFDADRLDYIQRDRYMTGIGLGVIDLTWLLDNVRVANIDVSPASPDSTAVYTHSFCLGYKGREAAEDFLLARYRLYTNVYLHKTTRGIEQLMIAPLRSVAEEVSAGRASSLGIDPEHPLARFISGESETLADYLRLDDAVVWGVIDTLTRCSNQRISKISSRLRSREKPLALDIHTRFPDNKEHQRKARHLLEKMFAAKIGTDVFRDEAELGVYGTQGADDQKAQMRLMIQLQSGDIREITDFKETVIAEANLKQSLLRYYFLNQSDFDSASDEVGRIS